MSMRLIKRDKVRLKRKFRVRKSLKGNALKPRLSVFKSCKHLSVQLIDDESGVTLCSYGTYSKEMKGGRTKDNAKLIGTKIAELAKSKNVEKVVFDRGSYKYHGIIAELANGARSAGLQF